MEEILADPWVQNSLVCRQKRTTWSSRRRTTPTRCSLAIRGVMGSEARAELFSFLIILPTLCGSRREILGLWAGRWPSLSVSWNLSRERQEDCRFVSSSLAPSPVWGGDEGHMIVHMLAGPAARTPKPVGRE